MAADRAADHLALARELEQRDVDVAAKLDSVTAVLKRVDGARARAARIRAGLEAIPGEIGHAEQDERDARDREAVALRKLHEAELRLDELGRSRRAGRDVKEREERAVRRASVAAADAAAGVTRARERLQTLVSEEAALQAEGEGLAVEVRDVAGVVAEVPRLSDSGRAAPGESLEEIDEWGARAHAALFVVRGGLESERERIVLEANGLAAAVLGDHAGGSSVALVRRRLEQWVSDP